LLSGLIFFLLLFFFYQGQWMTEIQVGSCHGNWTSIKHKWQQDLLYVISCRCYILTVITALCLQFRKAPQKLQLVWCK
jgi:hypothetical protein